MSYVYCVCGDMRSNGSSFLSRYLPVCYMCSYLKLQSQAIIVHTWDQDSTFWGLSEDIIVETILFLVLAVAARLF